MAIRIPEKYQNHLVVCCVVRLEYTKHEKMRGVSLNVSLQTLKIDMRVQTRALEAKA